MDFRSAVEYILGFTDYEKIPGHLYSAANYDLRRMNQLLEACGNPHLMAKSVQVVGTKGKGSTAAMLASILSAAGYRAALYTSPHLHSIRERIRIGDELIDEESFASITASLRPHIERINQAALHGRLTTFEILTALAFCFFAGGRVDFQVLEAGLGGRLDATNVVNSEVCVITSISYDHTEVLGKDLTQIAAEKAGIIKDGNTVVLSPQDERVTGVVRVVCRKRGARLIETAGVTSWRRTSAGPAGQSFTLKTPVKEYDLSIPLLGRHQLQNAANAVAAAEVLASRGAMISSDDIAEGLRQVSWPGRLQVLGREPLVIADGAHNADSAARLRETIGEDFSADNVVIVLGMSSDKDIAGTIGSLMAAPARFIAVSSHHPRACQPSVLVSEVTRQGGSCEAATSLDEAMARATAMAGRQGLVLVTGSLFVVGETIDHFSRQKPPGDADPGARPRG